MASKSLNPVCLLLAAAVVSAPAVLAAETLPPETLRPETLHYEAEWRLMDAGRVRLHWAPNQASMKLETVGLVRKLYLVDNDYGVQFRNGFCADSSLMTSEEGKKRRRTTVDYRAGGKAIYQVRDRNANDEVIETREVTVPDCVHDVVTGLAKLRTLGLKPGAALTLPVSDGRKSAPVRIQAQGKETIRTPAGVFSTVRCEIFLMNDVIYRRKARLLVWLTEDPRHLPVQIRLQMPFWLGTVTIKLAREEPG
ncbi:MAG: DUF3108 domain-containing protein [Bryobacteraceae bacterium]